MKTLVILFAIVLIIFGTYYNLRENTNSNLAFYCWGFLVGALSLILFLFLL